MQLDFEALVRTQPRLLGEAWWPATPCPKEGTSHQQEYKPKVLSHQELNASLDLVYFDVILARPLLHF